MAAARGHVVLLPFQFSNLSASKLRPALVLADAGRGDWLLCQITSKPFADAQAVTLETADFAQGGLQRTSYAPLGSCSLPMKPCSRAGRRTASLRNWSGVRCRGGTGAQRAVSAGQVRVNA